MSKEKQASRQNTEQKQPAESARQKRLEVSLRANLLKRKEQARQRQKGRVELY